MKKKALVAAVLAATTLSATTAFAAQNPFNDLPKDHWAYDAVTMLAEDGVLEGYGDGSFKGDKLMNRYEMAELVSKVVDKYDLVRPADKGVIKKLEREFATELKDMDVRLKAVENDVQDLKNKQSSFKWFGDARIRYFQNKSGTAIKNHDNSGNYKTRDQAEMRIRLGLYGEPAENLSVTGQLKAENANIARSDYNGGHYAGKNDEKMSFNRLQLDWHAKNQFTVSAGRNEVKLGQGLIYWENPIDGVMVQKDFTDKASLSIGAGDASAATWANSSELATFANLNYKVSPAVKLSAAYFNSHSDATVDKSSDFSATWNNRDWYTKNMSNSITRDFRQLAFGVDAQLSPKWNVVAEFVHNYADPKRTSSSDDVSTATGINASDANAYLATNDGRNGFWTRLTYGNMTWNKANTWKVYGEYFALGGLAVDSSGWAHRLNIAGGNGYGGAGVRGYGLAFDYMLADNTNLELTYYKLKPYDSGSAGFSAYKDTAFASLTYSF